MTDDHCGGDDLIHTENYMGHVVEINFDWLTTSPLLDEGYTIERWVPVTGFPRLNNAINASDVPDSIRRMLKNNDPEFLPRIYRIITARTKFNIKAVHINLKTGDLTIGRCWPGHAHSNGAIWMEGSQLTRSITNTITAHNAHVVGDRYYYTIDTHPDETINSGFTTPEKALHHASRYIDSLIRSDQSNQSSRLRLEPNRPRLHLVRNSGKTSQG